VQPKRRQVAQGALKGPVAVAFQHAIKIALPQHSILVGSDAHNRRGQVGLRVFSKEGKQFF
jgi:hypothetical protein